MKQLLKFRKGFKKKATFLMLSLFAVAMNTCFAFASDPTAAMTTAFTTVKTDALATLNAVAPIGISITAAFMVWKLGIKFFKALAK